MMETMDTLYSGKTSPQLKPVDIVKEANFYAALFDKNWYRVKALSAVDKHDKVKVSLIDHGEVDEVRKDCVFNLEEELTDVPPQVRSHILYTVEELYISTNKDDKRGWENHLVSVEPVLPSVRLWP